MRTLHFDPDSRKYQRLYACLVSGVKTNNSREEGRTHGALLDKLETIGQIKPPINPDTGAPRDFFDGEVRFYVTVTGGVIVLENAEWRMAVDHCTACIPRIHAALSRELEQTLAWLEALPEEQPKPAAAG